MHCVCVNDHGNAHRLLVGDVPYTLTTHPTGFQQLAAVNDGVASCTVATFQHNWGHALPLILDRCFCGSSCDRAVGLYRARRTAQKAPGSTRAAAAGLLDQIG